MKAAILARVSTAKQKDNSSLDSQVERCTEFCAEQSYEVVKVARETFSGSFVLARDEFQSLLELGRQGQIDFIVVDIPDRLGRGDAIAQCEMLARMNNCRILYATSGHDTATVEGLVQHSAASMVSGIERLNIRRRTMDGRTNWARAGRIIAPSRRPYGYRVVNSYDRGGRKLDSTFEIVEDEAVVVRIVFEMIAYECLTSSAVARRLTERGVPRISDTDEDYIKLRQLAPVSMPGWAATTVRNMVRSTLYRGEWRYGKTTAVREDSPQGVRRTVTPRALEDQIVVPVPAIVSEGLWQLANDQLDENKRKFVKPSRFEYLLRGRVRCALCGGMYTGKTIVNRYGTPYSLYACRKARKSYAGSGHQCSAKTLPGRKVEAAVWASIRDALLDDRNVWEHIRQQRVEGAEIRASLEQSIATLEEKQERAQAASRRLVDLFLSGDIGKEEMRSRKAALDSELSRRASEIDRMRRSLDDTHAIPLEQESAIREFQRQIAGRMTDDVPFTERLKLFDLLRIECVYNSATRELVISGVLGRYTVVMPSGCHNQCTLPLVLLIHL